MFRFCLTVVAALAFCLPSAVAEAPPMAPKPTKRVPPIYPREAAAQNIEGRVTAYLTIDEDGEITAIDIAAEVPMGLGFGEAARESLKDWEFPANQPGRYTVVMRFKLPNAPPEPSSIPKAPKPATRILPVYPEAALAAGLRADVMIVLYIDGAGAVSHARLDYEHPPGYGFGEAALAAVRGWTFPKGTTPSYYKVEVRFRLEEDGQSDFIFDPDTLIDAPPRISGNDPVYPAKARDAGVEGYATIVVQLTQDGRISHAGMLDEAPLGMDFGAAAYTAVAMWRFGDVKPGAYKVRVDFKLPAD